MESTVSILRGLKPRYETHHGVGISDGALVIGERRASRRGMFYLSLLPCSSRSVLVQIHLR